LNILQAMDDPNLFAPWFARSPESWSAWRAFLAALHALPMSPEQLATYRACTGRTVPPDSPASEAWLVCGRRAGKSFVLALVAVYLACFRDWRPHLAPGERATIMVIATDRRQARTIMRYTCALLTRIPMLRRLVLRERESAFELSCDVSIEIHVASFRAVRGYTVVAALLDEVAFFATSENAADPDYEIVAALRPAMATVPGAMLLCASSPYARRGVLWDAHRRHWGRDDSPALVWQAPTSAMNPTVPQRVIDEAYERDPASAAAEYGAQFRSDVESFVSREAVEACVDVGVRERPPLSRLHYVGFVDPSGGSSDSMTLAIAHREGDVAVLDAVRERRPPFSPSAVVEEFSELLRAYRVARVVGDRYGGEFCREPFLVRGVRYEPGAKAKSDIYRDSLGALNSGRVSLLDNDKLISQLVSLERRTARGGRDSIDHPPGQHDDLANAAAGALDAVSDAAGAYARGLRSALRGVVGPTARPRVTIGERLADTPVPSARRAPDGPRVL
jgi:hypothetical protein